MPAQIIFARFPAPSHRAAVDWMRQVEEIRAVHAADLRGADAAPAPVGSVVGWRLVSDNHREIARGCRFAASERLARHDAGQLLRRVTDLTVHASIEPRMRTTGWFVTLDDELVIVSARRYENRSVARNAGALAVRLLSELAQARTADADELGRSAPEFAL